MSKGVPWDSSIAVVIFDHLISRFIISHLAVNLDGSIERGYLGQARLCTASLTTHPNNCSDVLLKPGPQCDGPAPFQVRETSPMHRSQEKSKQSERCVPCVVHYKVAPLVSTRNRVTPDFDRSGRCVPSTWWKGNSFLSGPRVLPLASGISTHY